MPEISRFFGIVIEGKYGDITRISPLVKPEAIALSSFISRLGSNELILPHIVL